MKYKLIIFFNLLSIVSCDIQKELQKADIAFEQKNYAKSIDLYLNILDREDIKAVYPKIGDNYRYLDNWQEAEYWYGQSVHLPNITPEYYKYYAKSLLSNEKYDLAKEWLIKYLDFVPVDSNSVRQLIAKCKPSVIYPFCYDCYEIDLLPFKTSEDVSYPVLYNNQLIFSSYKLGRLWYQGNSFRQVKKPVLYSLSIDTLDSTYPYYNYPKKPKKSHFKHANILTFVSNQSKLYLTQFDFIDERWKTSIKIAVEDSIGQISYLEDFPHNENDYNTAYPSLSRDGKIMYFSADINGGFGGLDLYYSIFENGQWAKPVNLGGIINTIGDEITPFYDDNNQRLYFSSDGHHQNNGLDVYYTNVTNQDHTRSVIHADFSLNSNVDDFGLILNETGNFGYFTSNRIFFNRKEGALNKDAIFSIKFNTNTIHIKIVDAFSNLPIQNVLLKTPMNRSNLYTDSDGLVKFDLGINNSLELICSKKGYKTETIKIHSKDYETSTPFLKTVNLVTTKQ